MNTNLLKIKQYHYYNTLQLDLISLILDKFFEEIDIPFKEELSQPNIEDEGVIIKYYNLSIYLTPSLESKTIYLLKNFPVDIRSKNTQLYKEVFNNVNLLEDQVRYLKFDTIIFKLELPYFF